MLKYQRKLRFFTSLALSLFLFSLVFNTNAQSPLDNLFGEAFSTVGGQARSIVARLSNSWTLSGLSLPTRAENISEIVGSATVPTPTPTPPITNGKIAFETNRDGNSEIYLMNMDGSNPTRLTDDNSRDADPFFSPDGLRIVFPTNRHGNYEIYVMNVDGSNLTRLTSNFFDDLRPAFSPDGSKIVFYRNTESGSEIYVMNADGTAEVRLTNNSSSDEFPKWSPDGTRIIFYSNRDGDDEIYTMTLDGLNVVKLTNNNSRDWEASFTRRLKDLICQRTYRH